MELIDIIEYCILFSGLYYLYNISTSYLSLKSRREFYKKYKILFFLAILGDIGMISTFQIFWLTSYFNRHRILEIFIKIALGIFSIMNQFLVYELEEETFNMNKRRNRESGEYNIGDGKIGFKVINRLYLLIILYKFFNRNEPV